MAAEIHWQDDEPNRFVLVVDNMKGMMFSFGPYTLNKVCSLHKVLKCAPGTFKRIVPLNKRSVFVGGRKFS